MVYFYLAWVEWLSLAYTFWPLDCAHRSFEKDYFFSSVYPSLPVFVPGPEFVIREELFSFDFLISGVGVMPGRVRLL